MDPKSLWGLAAAILFLAAPLAAQNKVTNPNFTSNDAGWDDPVPGNGTFVQDPLLDANGPPPGSGLLTNVISSLFGTVSFRQCISGITPGAQYYWGGRIRFPNAEATTGSTVVNAIFYDAASCAGNVLGSAAGAVRDPLVDARGVWHTSNHGTSAAGFTAPVGSVTAQINGVLTKNEMGGSRSANFDDMFFAQVGTVPVELVKFSVD